MRVRGIDVKQRPDESGTSADPTSFPSAVTITRYTPPPLSLAANDTLAGPRNVAALNRSPDAELTIGALKSLSVMTARLIENSATGSLGQSWPSGT